MALDLLGEYDGDISEFKVDDEYAKIHEHNNRRSDLHRLQELQRRGEVDSSESDDESSSSESEPELFDGKFMETLVKVRNQDPIIKQKNFKPFESEDDGESDDEEENDQKKKKKSKPKPKYLKDVMAEALLEQGGEDEDRVMIRKSYNQEQEEIRRKILDVVEQEEFDDDGEDLIKEKKRERSEEVDERIEEINKISDEYFGKDEGLDENEKILKDIVTKRVCITEEGDQGMRPDDFDILRPDDFDILSEDDEEVWDQMDYERQYNFRYEEDAGGRVEGHARRIEGSVRKKETRRGEQRKRKEARIAENDCRIREETKRLKNLKKKDIVEKLKKVMAIGGLTKGEACALDVDDLEDDFDPEEHDKKMKEMFNDDYYNAEDADFVDDEEDGHEDDMDKPDFGKEDELLGLPKDWDVCGTSDGFAAIREKIKSKAGSEDVEDEEYDEVALEKDMDEYHKIDYEGRIGDLTTRFKYAKVPPRRFGLSAKAIIMMNEKQLNQHVPLKKIAPYTETEFKVSKSTRKQLKLIEQEALSRNGKCHKNHVPKESRTSEPVVEEVKRVEVKEGNGDTGEPSKKRKRKDRMKEVKPSVVRRKAYGIGDPAPQRKNNRRWR